MTVAMLALFLFGLIVLWMSVYGYVVSAKTAEDYMLAGRGIGILVMFFFMLFAISSAWTFYGYVGYLYRHGPSYVFFIWGCVGGFAALYMLLGPRLWAVARLNRFLSPVEMLSVRYESRPLRLVLAILLLVFIVPYVCIQPRAVGDGFKALSGIDPWVGIVYTSALLVLVVLLGGMRTTAWVNVFLGLVFAATFLGSLVWIRVKLFPGGLTQAAETIRESAPALLSSPGPEGYFRHSIMGGLFFMGMLAFSWPHIVIGTLTSRDKMIFKWMPLLVLVVGGFLFYSIPFIWGSLLAPAVSLMEGTTWPLADPQKADYVLQTIVTAHLPAWFSVFVLMGVLGAALSTAAVQLMTAAILLSRDVMHAFVLPNAEDRVLIRWTKVAVVGIVVLSALVALWNPVSLAEYLTHIAVPGFVQWAPCLLGAVLWKRATGAGALAGVLSGVAVLVAGFALHVGSVAALVSVVLNAVVFVVVSLCTRPSSPEVLARFFDEADEFLSSRA